MAKKHPKIAFAKGRRFCIFCGAPADSEEHIMPQWAHPILPRSEKYRHTVGRGLRASGSISLSRNYLRQGSTFTTRIPVVCCSCNSGWMSSFEEKVRPTLERMLQGKRTFLRRDMRDKLAQYLTYKMLVLDWMGDDPILPPQWGRDFYRTKQIPRGVHIWLFRCLEYGDIETYGCGLAEIDDPRSETDLFPNSKSFAVGIGELFVFAVLSSEIELDTEFDAGVSAQLWPFKPKLMIWPPRFPINGGQARYVSGILKRIGKDPFVIDESG